jgi:FkbM family methyltransferase
MINKLKLTLLGSKLVYKILISLNFIDDTLFSKIKSITKVIHVGAGTTQERFLYNAFQKNVTWIEAHPEQFLISKKNLLRFRNQKIFNYAVSNKNEYINFHELKNKFGFGPSSIFEWNSKNTVYEGLEQGNILKVEAFKLCEIIKKEQITLENSPEENLLVLDIQGAEFIALQGVSKDILMKFGYLQVESFNFEEYKGIAKDEEIVDYLESFGFERRYLVKKGFNFNESKYSADSIFVQKSIERRNIDKLFV